MVRVDPHGFRTGWGTRGVPAVGGFGDLRGAVPGAVEQFAEHRAGTVVAPVNVARGVPAEGVVRTGTPAPLFRGPWMHAIGTVLPYHRVCPVGQAAGPIGQRSALAVQGSAPSDGRVTIFPPETDFDALRPELARLRATQV